MGENYLRTTLLRNNPGMIRDCWVEKDATGKTVLRLRQIKFADPSSPEVQVKTIGLVDEEIEILLGVIQKGFAG